MQHVISQELIFDKLNAEQKEAVVNISGPVLILAGAGSGKTRALTHRVAYLLSQGVQPWQILCVTFTNKAATEMKERIRNMLHLAEEKDPTFGLPIDAASKAGSMPVMGTFHSICVRVLRRDIEKLGRDRNFVIYDSDDQERLMKKVLKDLRIEENELKARAALSYVGRFKSEALSPRDAMADATTDRLLRIVQVYSAYQKELALANAMDFDDLILETVRLFHEHPDVLNRYQDTWRYLHVDEYQDTNHAQYLFITLLAKKYRNLCVIGDPDQSIYGFRGADIRNILEFETEYPDAKRIKLEQNYRSAQPILTAADVLISLNPNRPEKRMWTDRKDGPLVVVQEVRDEKREAEEAISQIQQKQRDGVPLKEQVILYRTHAQSRLFEEACMRAGLPYRILGGVKFYVRKEVKDVLAYLYAILNPNDTVSMLRIINVPTRKLGDTTMGYIQAYASTNQMTLWNSLQHVDEIDEINEGAKNRIRQFTDVIRKYQALSLREVASSLAASLIEEVKMEAWLKEGTEEGEERWNNVQELLTVMHKYDALEPHASLTGFLEEVALVSEVDKLNAGNNDSLTLMTLHLCKGLEFEHVIMVGCEEGLFPHSSAVFDHAQLEEERRIMYVGMTRAKTHLRILFAQSRFLWGDRQSNAPSRFLADLPAEAIERRSDDVLSAFAWASASGQRAAHEMGTPSFGNTSRRSSSPLEPFKQDLNLEFNQDMGGNDSVNQDPDQAPLGGGMREGSRVSHPTFGQGTVTAKRGDVVDVLFDGGKKKTLALSIAPLKVI
jgi:DNA helicase-2/ATP-dependent DNA helicase PcrA